MGVGRLRPPDAPRPHWNPEASKDDLGHDINDLISKISRDQTEHLKHPERIAKTDLLMLERVLGEAWDRIKKAEGIEG